MTGNGIAKNGTLLSNAFTELRTTLRSVFSNNEGTYAYPSFGRRGEAREQNKLDLDCECGYPDSAELTADYFLQAYRRWGVAARVVDIWPDECWAVYPDVYETEDTEPTAFENSWEALVESTHLFYHLHRADRLSRIGRFGAVLLGLDDGGDFSKSPVGIDGKTGVKTREIERKLLYMRAFDESLVTVDEYDGNIRSPRYGLPVSYSINFGATDSDDGEVIIPSSPGEPEDSTVHFHWTRILHLADNRISSEVFGEPAMKPVLNHLIDMRKVAGSSAEMFFKGGFPGYAFETFPDLTGEAAIDDDALALQIQQYTKGLQRYLATVGGSWKSLQPQVANPSPHLEWYGRLVTATIGVPTRIFFGAESGHLASTQDDHSWRTRLKGRQQKYLDPMVLRPFIARMQALGVLPEVEKYHTAWQDLRNLSDADQADVALKKVQAMMQFVAGGVNQLMPPRMLMTMVMGFTEDQATAIEKELKEHPPEELVLPGGGSDQFGSASGSGGGNRAGNVPKGPVGKPAGKPPGK